MSGVVCKSARRIGQNQHQPPSCCRIEVDPSLIFCLAPKLKDLLNTQDAAHHLGVSVDLL
mgnify:CR=1|jgi:hypothetical protein